MILPASQLRELNDLLKQLAALLEKLVANGYITIIKTGSTMAIKIDKKITGYKVVTDADKPKPVVEVKPLLKVKRPAALQGMTYRIDEPSKQQMLVTITNIEHDNATRPYELLINSPEVGHSQWTDALSRVTSALFKRGGAVRFIADELREIHDPHGGWFEKGKKVPSTVAAIGDAMIQHFDNLGLKI